MTAYDHQPLVAVDFDPRSALRPIRKHVGVANKRVDFEHVGRVEGQLHRDDKIVFESERGDLRVGCLGGPFGVEPTAGAEDVLRKIEADDHAGQIELVDSIVA